MARKDKVCLVLGGGGARGLSHLGVLQVLEREGVPIDCIVGTSVGAVVGAVYALEPNAKEVTRRALSYFKSDAFRNNTFKRVVLKSEDVEQNFFKNLFSGIRKSYVFSNLLRKRSIFPGERLYELIADLVPDKQFSDVKVPFAVPALDIRSGSEVFITTGPLRRAVYASCSLPGFFPPVEMGEMLLADAGTIGPVPVGAAVDHFQPSATVAVDITSRLDQCAYAARGLDAILRVEAIACKRFNEIELQKADIVISPQVGAKFWSDFSDFDALVEQGIQAADAKVPELQALLQRRGLFGFLRKFAPAR
jgi:NTE family protein